MAESAESLNDALDNIQSDRLKDREKGLADLRHALSLKRKAPSVGKAIKNRSIHSACEKLFQNVSTERSTYVKATKITTKSLSANRLASCASTIRLMVEVFVTSMRLKTVQAIVGHIIQTLPTADGGFCTPLALDFFKALSTILDCQPHVEHLDHETWLDLIEFCINGLSRDITENTIELLGCLRSLTMASNCPLLQKAPEIIRAATNFISKSSSTTAAHHAAFETINACLKVLSTHSEKLMTWALAETLPLIKNLWHRKQSILRDEMLATLIYSKAHLVSLRQNDQNEALLPVVEALLETMSAEYFESRERGHLDLDQLSLYTRDRPPMQVMPMQCSTFGLRRSTKDGEHNWTVLHFLAFFTNWVDSHRDFHVEKHTTARERSPKRRRITSRLLEFTHFAGNVSNPEKLAYRLQIIAFAMAQRSLSHPELASMSDFLSRNAVHENGDISSWSLLSLANCAFQSSHDFSAFHSLWLKVWHLANRLISSIPQCRAACHLLDVLLCSMKVRVEDVADSVDTLISSASLSGPALLSDSALSMWLTILERRSASSPAQRGDADYDKLLEWICSKWKPSDFENRSYSYQLTREISTSSFEAAFSTIIAQRLAYSGDSALANLGKLGEAWLFQWLHKPLTDYLLLTGNGLPPFRLSKCNHLDSRIKSSPNLQSRARSGMVFLQFLGFEAEKAIKAWHEIRDNRSSTINEDMIQVLFAFCIVGTVVANTLQNTNEEQVINLQLKLSDLAKHIIEYCCDGRDISKISALFQVISPFFPRLSANHGARYLSLVAEPLATILGHFAQSLECNREELDTISAENAMDLDELEFDEESKGSKGFSVSRRQDSACCNERSFVESGACYVQFLCCLSHENSNESNSEKIPTAFVKHIMSLSPEDLISSRPLIKMILSSKFELHIQDVGDLLEHLHHTLLDPYEWNRCEVALGVCLDVMTGTALLWTDSSLVSVADFGAQLYEWFVETALENGILSTTSQIGFIDLLYRLLDIYPSYAEDISKPSVRTRLFQILKSGNLVVQYHISKHLINVFNSFVLSQHELIFDDIFESLPTELEHQEGIYVRMLVFTQIGSAWKSLLRRCLFHILETAGLVPETATHAEHCILQITKALVLPDARCVFRLFSPQLLHTWLELHPLKSIAYSIFGYRDLKSMLQEAKAQFLSQLLMIGSADKLDDFEIELGLPVKDVLATSFGQAAAYGIAKDLSMHGPSGTSSHATEARIRDTLGKHQYLELLRQELPVIVGHLFIRLEQEEHIEKMLSKKPEYTYAADTLKNIKDLGHSTSVLSHSQQPSFKSKLLLDEVERICRRINRNPIEIWTAPLVIRVARMLFEDANDAFGPLHACRTIQRLRLLVCLAGSTAVTGYPLEMLIHALRPFVTNNQCADDAIGLCRYLMDCGKDHLLQNSRFLAGTGLTLMLSLRDFLNSTQDSTTQGAQHRATLSRAETFRTWLGHYMESCSPKLLQSRSLERLRAMTSSAHQILGPGGASPETHEARLLMHLLDDIKEGNELLGEKFAIACITLLCKDFSGPSGFRDDVLGVDETAAYYAAAIWKTLCIPNPNSSYLHWAATALGRGFGHGGYVDPEIMQETNLKSLRRLQPAVSSLQDASTSKVSIIHSLVELLWDNRSETVDLAETALQYIVSQYKGSDDIVFVEKAVPKAIVDSFFFDAFGSLTSTRTEYAELSQVFSKLDSAFAEWIKELATAVVRISSDDPVLGAVLPLLIAVDGLAEKLFPFILHASLFTASFREDDSPQRQQLSQCFSQCLKIRNENSQPHLKSLINAALYLRTQPKPQERTILDRNEWIVFDMTEMASAAQHCKMFKTALLFTELGQPASIRSQGRRSSIPNVSHNQVSSGSLVSIFRELDEPDSFYGVEQQSDLESIAARLDYEGDNIQSLLLRGAKMDSQLRDNKLDHSQHTAAIIQSLGKLGLNSITSSLASTQRQAGLTNTVMDIMINSAMKLGQWDVAVPSANVTTGGLVYRTFQSIHGFTDLKNARQAINEGLLEILKGMDVLGWTGPTISSSFRALSALTEINDMLATQGKDEFFETWQKFLDRDSWMESSRPENVSLLLTSRETFCGILSHEVGLQNSLKLSARDSRLIEIFIDLHASEIYRKLGSLQESLLSVTYLSSLIEPSADKFHMKFDASVKKETADILWQRGELGASIKTLQDINETSDFEAHTVPVGASGLLADIAHRVSYARLEKPDDILNNYLKPALKRLKQVRHGPEAGKVFHEYATYCHKQLENPDSIEELRRSERFKRQRTTEVRELKSALLAMKNNEEKMTAKKEYDNARRWLKIDEQENQRLRDAREQFLKSSLEHYLRSLAACDEFDTNVIRFLAIWLGNSENDTANKPVRDFQSRVPSKKFAVLMNQLSSRLQETENVFQSILGDIVMRICQDHPYHGMYHIFAGSKTSGGNDSQARSRNGAANKIAKKLENNPKTGPIWTSVHRSNELYNRMANLPPGEKKQGTKLTMKQFDPSKAVAHEIPGLKVPPITMTIDIRDNLNYDGVPTVVDFRPEMTIASGISSPKIITAVASNGLRYRQLFKGGTDDLRQDAIMEQVFEQVTSLLKTNKATRQRGLGVRTYKVVPLDAQSGAIEFVEPTMSLNEFLIDAHRRYHPKDLKWQACRDKMGDVAELDLSARLKEFQNIKSRFSPVLRHFFFERFENPDDWFERRLAYTRSTAAISILGYVLGLGDRHCQNILLDTKTGEVVHIDLGVAFEAGRILPKPETVPFRLTRDIVDGFGILKTEGVFRRCCEFTLEALRQNKDTILTLLNVLRYDPLHSWSVSPLRAKRLQEEQQSRIAEAKAGSVAPSRAMSRRSSAAAQEEVNDEVELLKEKDRNDEGGEADRALTTVDKKLTAGLSVSATVNELIQQATDDKNLAVLFHGWAPFA